MRLITLNKNASTAPIGSQLMLRAVLLAGLMLTAEAHSENHSETVELHTHKKRASLGGYALLWPRGKVYYLLKEASPTLKQLVKQAVSEISVNAPGIQFIEISDPSSSEALDIKGLRYISIRSEPDNGSNRCGESVVGMRLRDGSQDLWIRRGDFCETRYNILHELMHALGFRHEHQRKDRDRYISVPQGEEMQINEGIITDSSFDLESVMHYQRNDIISRSNQPFNPGKGKEVLSDGDIDSLNKIYPFVSSYLTAKHLLLPIKQAQSVLLFVKVPLLPAFPTTGPELAVQHEQLSANQYAKVYKLTLTHFADTQAFASQTIDIPLQDASGMTVDTLSLTVLTSGLRPLNVSSPVQTSIRESGGELYSQGPSLWLIANQKCLEAQGHFPTLRGGYETALVSCDSTNLAQRWYYTTDARLINRLYPRHCLSARLYRRYDRYEEVDPTVHFGELLPCDATAKQQWTYTGRESTACFETQEKAPLWVFEGLPVEDHFWTWYAFPESATTERRLTRHPDPDDIDR